MITAIDSNVLLDVLIPNEAFADAAAASIEDAASHGSLVVNDIVYVEVCIQFGMQRECDDFFDSNEIRVEPLNRPPNASFAGHAEQRRPASPGQRRKLGDGPQSRGPLAGETAL